MVSTVARMLSHSAFGPAISLLVLLRYSPLLQLALHHGAVKIY